MIPYILIPAGCSNDCIFCSDSKEPMNKKQLEANLLKDTKFWKKKNVKEIIISGADPTEYKKLPEYLNWASKFFEKIHIYGNCLKFSNIHHINKISDLSSKINFRIGLYGSFDILHDSITKNNGSFNKLIKSIENIKNQNFNLTISTLFLKQNQGDMDKIIKLINKYTKNISIGLPLPLSQKNYKYYKPNLESIKIKLNHFFNSKLFLKFSSTTIEYVPPCLFNDVKANFSNKTPIEKTNNYESNFPSLKKIKKCETCVHKNNCDGIFEQYLSELENLT